MSRRVTSHVITIRDNESYWKWRRPMYDFDKRCYWCKVPTVWSTPPDGILPDNAATIDHLVSRNHPERQNGARNTCEVVLSCYKCNRDRNDKEILSIPLPERRLKSYTPEYLAKIREHVEKNPNDWQTAQKLVGLR